jgi:hypothetical protein
MSVKLGNHRELHVNTCTSRDASRPHLLLALLACAPCMLHSSKHYHHQRSRKQIRDRARRRSACHACACVSYSRQRGRWRAGHRLREQAIRSQALIPSTSSLLQREYARRLRELARQPAAGGLDRVRAERVSSRLTGRRRDCARTVVVTGGG